jgi:putative phosphonate metabolism protein
MSARYAIYFAPDRHSPWWVFGAHWLGRNEHDNTPLPQPRLEVLSPAELAAITAEPRRYGFHATLKAPFRLLSDHAEADLVARLGRLAQTLTPVTLGTLRAESLGDFVALVPDADPAGLQTLAAACVTGLDDLRAPLDEPELARRRKAGLDPRENELLARYGYPFVLERFRLHLTLTGPIGPDMAQQVLRAVDSDVARLNDEAPLILDRLCLFVERSPGAAFQRIIDVRLSQ